MGNTDHTSGRPAAASRRAMLFGASGAVAGAAALALAARTPLPDAEQALQALPTPEKGGGYRVTPHNLHYYATTLV